MWELIWYVDVNNLLDAFLNYFLWLMIYLCKLHVIKFIISLILLIQIFFYYLLEMLLIAFISTSFEFFFLWLIIYLCKSHVIKFIIFLISFIQILVYYLLEVLLIAFISISFEIFFSKICYNFRIFPKKKSILQNKRNRFLL